MYVSGVYRTSALDGSHPSPPPFLPWDTTRRQVLGVVYGANNVRLGVGALLLPPPRTRKFVGEPRPEWNVVVPAEEGSSIVASAKGTIRTFIGTGKALKDPMWRAIPVRPPSPMLIVTPVMVDPSLVDDKDEDAGSDTSSMLTPLAPGSPTPTPELVAPADVPQNSLTSPLSSELSSLAPPEPAQQADDGTVNVPSEDGGATMLAEPAVSIAPQTLIRVIRDALRHADKPVVRVDTHVPDTTG
jgi:hypothetical protein